MTKDESQLLKGIAIVLMLIHHLFYDPAIFEEFNVNTLVLSQQQWFYLSFFGKSCVAIFVFISGYGMTKSLESFSGEPWQYIARRYIRLMAPFFLIYILALAASVPTGHCDVYRGQGIINAGYNVIVDAFGLANMLGTPTLNGTWWYMTLAILLVLLVPLLNTVYEKVGTIGCVILCFLVPFCLGIKETDILGWYFPSAVAGVLAAKLSLFERAKQTCNTIPKKAIVVVIAVGLYVTLIQIRWIDGHYWLTDALMALLLGFIAPYVLRVPAVNSITKLLGKHSMTIFLTHTFIYYYYFQDFIFSFHYPILILLVLLICSLLLSMAIECLKKIVKFDKLEITLIDNLTKSCSIQKSNAK